MRVCTPGIYFPHLRSELVFINVRRSCRTATKDQKQRPPLLAQCRDALQVSFLSGMSRKRGLSMGVIPAAVFFAFVLSLRVLCQLTRARTM